MISHVRLLCRTVDYDIQDTQPAQNKRQPNRVTTCVWAASIPSSTDQRYLLGWHEFEKIDNVFCQCSHFVHLVISFRNIDVTCSAKCTDVYSDPRPHGKSSPSSSMGSSPGGTTAPGANFPSSRRLDPSVEQRSGSPPAMPAEPTSSDQPSSKPGGPASGIPGPPGQPSRPSHASGDSFNLGGRPMGDPSHHPGFNHNSGGRGGPPPLLMMTTHTASPTLAAPGTGRHGDGGPSQRSRTSGQSVSGAAGNQMTGDVMYTTLAALCSTVGVLLTSFVNRSCSGRSLWARKHCTSQSYFTPSSRKSCLWWYFACTIKENTFNFPWERNSSL